MITKSKILFGAFLIAGLSIKTVQAAPDTTASPGAISDLAAAPGATPGSIILTWTAPSADGGAPNTGPVFRYFIKYQVGGLIPGESHWVGANSIEGYPTYKNPPMPSTPTTTQSIVLTGLQTGVSYGFAIKSMDTHNQQSVLSNSTMAVAASACTGATGDGEGVLGINPNNIKSGQYSIIYTTVTVGPNGIGTGGALLYRIPDTWIPLQNSYPPGSGYFSYFTSSGVTAALGQTYNGQELRLDVNSGTLAPGDKVFIRYTANPYQVGSIGRFRVKVQGSECGQLVEISTPVLNVNVTAGDPRFIAFADTNNGNMAVPLNTAVPLTLVVRDFHWNIVAATATMTAQVEAVRYSTGNYITDTVASISTNGVTFASAPLTVNFTAGQSSKTVHYRISSTAFKPDNRFRLTTSETLPPYNTFYFELPIQPVASGITDSSIDLGTLVNGQKSVIFSPDGDRVNDEVFIRATMPDAMSWQVRISSNNFATTTRQFYGYGHQVNVIWDGYADSFGQTFPLMAPATTYAIRISDSGGGLTDTTLSASLVTLGIRGVIKDSSSATVANADINLFGPVNRFFRTGADGSFDLGGLRAGVYQLRITKPGFSNFETPVTITNGVLNVGNLFLTRVSILRLVVTRPITGTLPELWGNVNAFDSQWREQSYGSLHFGMGKSTADAGDFWNVTQTTYTDISFSPNKAFTVRFNLPGAGVSDIVFSTGIAANVITERTVVLTRRPDITGLVRIPAGSNPTGMWISVDASRIGGAAQQSQQFYGGVFLGADQSCGTYRINGVLDGSYTLRGFAPGFVMKSTTAFVSPGIDSENNDFPLFDTGGVITGSVTVNGDTTSQGFGGFLNLPVNAWSRTNYTGSYANVSVPTDLTSASTNYTLKGLADGTYELNLWLYGFELVPPGPKTVTVSGGVGNLNLTLLKNSGVVSGTINLGGNTDWANVIVELLPYSSGNTFSTTGAGPGQYSLTGIGTDFYTLRAYYKTTGLTVERSVRVTNGQTTTVNLDLSGTTYSISGRVTTDVENLSYFVNSTTATTINTTTGTATMPAHRIEAFRIQGRDFGQYNNSTTACVPPFRDLRNWFVGVFDSNGNYTIPNLSPGIYKIVNNAELDNDCSTGKEIAETTKIVAITNQSLTEQDFTLKDGVDVTGSLTVANGTFESGRNIEVTIRQRDRNNDPSKDTILARQVVYLEGVSGSFSLKHIPEGNYSLVAMDYQMPRKYIGEELPLTVGTSDISNKELKLYAVSKIQGQLRIKTSGEIITASNYQQLLPDRFFIFASANPWKPGGNYSSEFPIIGADGKFTIMTGPGNFDVEFRSDEFTQESAAKGKKALVNVRMSGIKVEAGQIKDLGVVDLTEGITLSGTVRDSAGVPIPNIPMEARPASGDGHDSIAAFTNHLGQYTFNGLDKENVRYYDIYCAKRIDTRDNRFRGLTGPLYEQVIKANVDLQAVTSLDFTTQEANGSIRGRILTPDSGALLVPFGDTPGQPGAAVIANKDGNIPTSNPIGDIEEEAQPDGTFVIKGLARGRYKVVGIALGYGSVSKIVDVGTGETNIGDITLVTGAKLSGAVYLADGVNRPDTNAIGTLIAVSEGFLDILIAKLVTAGNTITGYELSGFKPNKSYSILGFPEDDSAVTTLASGLIVNADATKDLKVGESAPLILPQVTRDDDGVLTISFNFSSALDNSEIDLDANGIADNSDPDYICTIVTGGGALSNGTIATDRKSFKVNYTPVAGDTSVVLQMNVVFNKEKSTDGENYSVTKNFTFFPGIGDEITVQVANASGGDAELETSAFTAPPGIFGDDAEAAHEIKFRASGEIDNILAGAPGASGAGSMALAESLGFRGYPKGMGAAMHKAKALAAQPLSSFYDVFLPAGVSHFFPEGREANLCLTYDDGVADPYSLNIYYFNEATSEYLLESEGRVVDTVNQRICVDISHASIFTVFASSAAVITGDSYTGELTILNFPNPFNLKSKSITLQHPGSNTAAQTITGTMIKVSVPPSMSGVVEIEIFNVLGEKVRTLHADAGSGGTHLYVEWDGKNSGGEKVASGTYIGRVTIGGSEERFFKMAVLK